MLLIVVLGSKFNMVSSFWTNGVPTRVAEVASNIFNPSVLKKSVAAGQFKPAAAPSAVSITNQPKLILPVGIF